MARGAGLLLLLCCLGPLLRGAAGLSQAPREAEPGAATPGVPLGKAVSDLSGQYWRYLACRLWREGCEQPQEVNWELQVSENG